MFTDYPAYPQFRSLGLTSPQLRGEDVYALQTALNACHFPCGLADGVLGPNTAQAIRDAQKTLKLSIVDGLAGGETQKALALKIATRVAGVQVVPVAAMKGQMEFESSFRLGRYSPLRSNGSYDAGLTQRNTEHTPARDGFDVPKSIEALAANTRKHFDLFEGVPTLRRRWGLAQGAWNAPAFACFLAREEGAKQVTRGMTASPTAEQRAKIEEYILHASMYLSTTM